MHPIRSTYTLLLCRYVVGFCESGNIRLTGGKRERDGKVQMCNYGEWSTVCGKQNNITGIACRHLGFSDSFHCEYK